MFDAAKFGLLDEAFGFLPQPSLHEPKKPKHRNPSSEP
jgi:hypothetical protein